MSDPSKGSRSWTLDQGEDFFELAKLLANMAMALVRFSMVDSLEGAILGWLGVRNVLAGEGRGSWSD